MTKPIELLREAENSKRFTRGDEFAVWISKREADRLIAHYEQDRPDEPYLASAILNEFTEKELETMYALYVLDRIHSETDQDSHDEQ